MPSASGARNLNHQGSPFIASFNKVLRVLFCARDHAESGENKSKQNHQGLCSHRTFHLVTGTVETTDTRQHDAFFPGEAQRCGPTRAGAPLSQRVAARGRLERPERVRSRDPEATWSEPPGRRVEAKQAQEGSAVRA